MSRRRQVPIGKSFRVSRESKRNALASETVQRENFNEELLSVVVWVFVIFVVPCFVLWLGKASYENWAGFIWAWAWILIAFGVETARSRGCFA